MQAVLAAKEDRAQATDAYSGDGGEGTARKGERWKGKSQPRIQGGGGAERRSSRSANAEGGGGRAASQRRMQ